jgi:hypothetical protein
MVTKDEFFALLDKCCQPVPQPRKPRVYWCKGCKNIINVLEVPIGDVITDGNGNTTYLCRKCKK